MFINFRLSKIANFFLNTSAKQLVIQLQRKKKSVLCLSTVCTIFKGRNMYKKMEVKLP